MTSSGAFAQSFTTQPRVRCSTCETDVELSMLAEHKCSVPSYGVLTGNPVRHHVADTTSVPQSYFTSEPAEIVTSAPYSPRNVPELSRQRPVVPKIDSNLSGRPARGLRAKEAANIAHDLGLPSPVSAGGGRRSPRPHNLRKGSSPRIPLAPPSPELPAGQDCAFPAFPISKPKRAHTVKVVANPKPIIASRAETHDASTSHSASSSTYSSSSGGFTRGRTSDTSWRPLSRQGTVDGAPTSPSTAPSSPRTSLTSKEKLDDLDSIANQQMNARDPSHTHETLAKPPSVAPPFSHSRTIDESEINNEYYNRINSSGSNSQDKWESGARASPVTFDSILNANVLPNNHDHSVPLREPSYKSKRPPPLDPSHTVAPEFQFAPLTSRPPSTASNTGLTRSLTNLFSRKRSQSFSSRKSTKFDVNGPRLKALAAEPPPVPQRGRGEFGLVHDNRESYFSSRSSHLASPSLSGHDVVSPLSAAERAAAMTNSASSGSVSISPLSASDQIQAPTEESVRAQYDVPGQETSFDFDFGKSTNGPLSQGPEPVGSGTSLVERTDSTLPGENSQSQRNPNRASTDSVSDYGSDRNSQQSINLAPSLFVPATLGSKISSALRDSTASFDMNPDFRSHAPAGFHNRAADIPRGHGRLSPVHESMASNQPHISPMEETHETSASARPGTGDMISHSPSESRLVMPAGNKGLCRGCSNIIEAGQKSVSSKDGRLTGRYHKECFNCQTCRRPFATADFYIFEDHPYCAHHYHVMNDTLCTSCGNGIEGQYLETFDVGGNESKKYHPRCLTCTTCRTQLQDDYFEFQGRVYCERDAFRAATGPLRSPYDNAPSRPSPLVREYISSGDPGTKGRFPERRTTRLMMIQGWAG